VSRAQAAGAGQHLLRHQWVGRAAGHRVEGDQHAGQADADDDDGDQQLDEGQAVLTCSLSLLGRGLG
jgi:hypothetical protein